MFDLFFVAWVYLFIVATWYCLFSFAQRNGRKILVFVGILWIQPNNILYKLRFKEGYKTPKKIDFNKHLTTQKHDNKQALKRLI